MNHIHEAEVKILGTFAKHQDLFSGIEHLVFDELFIRPDSRAVYSLIKSFHDQKIEPDSVLIFQSLLKQGISQKQAADWTALAVDYRCLNNPRPYIHILFNHWVSQKMMPVIYDCYNKFNTQSADSLEVLQLIKDATTQIDLVLNNAKTDKSVHDIFDEFYQRLVDLKEGTIENTGYSFGLSELNRKTGGLMKGITVIGALPGQGKTSLIINILKANTIDSNVPSMLFSIEMPAIEIMTNLVSNATSINSRAMREGDVDAGNLMSISDVKHRLKSNLSIDDNGAVTWQYIEAKIRAFKKANNVPADKTTLVMIDYLQLMSNSQDEFKGTTDEQRLSKICKELTRIAKVENCAIVLLSQLSRKDRQDNPRPKMSDLKGSGAIEACAILILLLFRPEYHGIYEDDKGNDLRGLCEINPVKGRYIKPEPVYVRFLGKYSRFEDYSVDGAIKSSDSTF